MREIKLIRYEWNSSDITDGLLTFTVDGQEKTLTNAFYRECTIKWGDNQKEERFQAWKLDPFARNRLMLGFNFNFSEEEIDYLEGLFDRKMKHVLF